MSALSPQFLSRTCRALPAALLTTGVAISAVLVVAPGVASAASTIHVATNGSDGGAGTASSPFRTVQRAVTAAGPGDSILVHKGTYTGRVTITRSGTSSAPITLQTAGDGAVTLTNSFPGRPCSETSPAVDRTVTVKEGADYWTIKGFNINNGVWVSGHNASKFASWFSGEHRSGAWQERRAIPGQGAQSLAASRSAVSYMNNRLHLSGKAALEPSDGVQVIGNNITGRGVHATLARDGKIQGNTIHDIACGTGPGVWIVALSSNWQVTGNDVYDVKDTVIHHMQEGIRLSDAASYNTVAGNNVHDLPTDGRAFTTDVDASFNTFQGNTAAQVYIGYSDEMSGWGNRWTGNSVDHARRFAFGLMSPDWNRSSPSMDTSTRDVEVTCTRVTNSPEPQFIAGSSMGGHFDKNTFGSTLIAPNLKRYWGSAGNEWNGAGNAPSDFPAIPKTSGC